MVETKNFFIKEKHMKKNNKKLKKGIIISLSILGAITILLFALSHYIYGETSVFNKAISANPFVNTVYQKIPAVFKTVQIITIALKFELTEATNHVNMKKDKKGRQQTVSPNQIDSKNSRYVFSGHGRLFLRFITIITSEDVSETKVSNT